jgi:hypothetical protein
MPLSNPIIAEPVMNPLVGKIIKKSLPRPRCFGISRDIPQSIQSPASISIRKTRRVIPLFPTQSPPLARGGWGG